MFHSFRDTPLQEKRRRPSQSTISVILKSKNQRILSISLERIPYKNDDDETRL